jgi:alpha-tubulin suppressor-like RCC1 family protein
LSFHPSLRISLFAAALLTTHSSAWPQKPATTRATRIAFETLAAGDRFTCGLSAHGTAYCWGQDDFGQLGIGESVGRCDRSIYATGACARAPVEVFGGHEFVSITAGDAHACGINRNGAAYCWGQNHFDQLGVDVVADTCSRESSGSEPPMSLACSRRPVRVPIPAPVASIAAAEFFTCAVDVSGGAWCWGGIPAPTAVPVDRALVTVAAGGDQVCGLTTEGAIRCWRWRDVLTEGANAPSQNTNFKALAVGAGHACALDATGSAYCWGNDADGALGIGRNDHHKFEEVPPTPVVDGLRFRAIATGATQTCAIDASGQLFCWGRVAKGVADDECLDSNGVAGMNDCMTRPVHVHRRYRFATVAMGARHQCGITEAGQAMCWGQNDAGQLGNGTLRNTDVLTAVRTQGISPGEARRLDLLERAVWLLRSGVLLLVLLIIGLAYWSRPYVWAWWRAGSASGGPDAQNPAGTGWGKMALGAVISGWLFFALSIRSLATSELSGDVGYGIGMMVLLSSAAIALGLAGAAAVMALLTLRRNRDALAARIALPLALITLLAGVILAAKMFWPTER